MTTRSAVRDGRDTSARATSTAVGVPRPAASRPAAPPSGGDAEASEDDSRPAAILAGRHVHEEARAYLQRRLRGLLGASAVVLACGLGAVTVEAALLGQGPAQVLSHWLLRYPDSLFSGALCLAGLCFALTSRLRLSRRQLLTVDAVFLQGLFALVLVQFAMFPRYSFPGYTVSGVALAVIILSRAALVPSGEWRTLLLSAPAPLGVLLLQLLEGRTWADIGDAYPKSHFDSVVLLNQVVLWWAVGMASWTSRLQGGLRRRAREARRLGQYELEGCIGRGATGEVYRATHSLLKRPTAIKFLQAGMDDPRHVERFEREVRQTARLSHPNTVSVWDFGITVDGICYYAMELLDGRTLKEVVQAEGAMPPARVIHVLSSVCGALHEAHSMGLIHRDVKPANIMLCRQGGDDDVVKLLDFGLVKDLGGGDGSLTIEGQLVGTPETMPPEVLAGQRPDERSDLYSLGAVGHLLLTGRPLFQAHNAVAMLHAHGFEQPVPPSQLVAGIPADLEAVVLRALSKDPAERHASAAEMRDALLECAEAGRWTARDAALWAAMPPIRED